LPLPPDVGNPEVIGATFSLVEDGIDVEVDGNAQVEYTSSFHTRKEQGVWYFDAQVNSADSVQLLLPKNIQILQSQPRSAITKNNKVEVNWQDLLFTNISVSYVRLDSSPSVLTIPPLPTSKPNFFWLLALAVVLAGSYYFFKSKKAKNKEKTAKIVRNSNHDLPTIKDAQMNVIQAANDNEAIVLKLMLKHNGKIKRNALEKESGLSKSSLASSLKNLEKKNIVHIDRSFHVHYLTLSDWFKELK